VGIEAFELKVCVKRMNVLLEPNKEHLLIMEAIKNFL
jgi:hypothetical protein